MRRNLTQYLQTAIRLASSKLRGLAGGWQYSDHKIIDMACDVTALAAVKEGERQSLGKEGLYHVRTLTNVIREECRQLGKGVGAPQSLGLSKEESPTHCSVSSSPSGSNSGSSVSTTTFRPLDGWDHLAEGVDEEEIQSLIGDVTEAPPPVFIDLLETPGEKEQNCEERRKLKEKDLWSFEELVEAFELTQKRGETLYARGEATGTSTPIHQVSFYF